MKAGLAWRVTAACLATNLLVAAATLASAQTRQSAREDGKAFGAAIGAKAQQGATRAPTADTVPNYRPGTQQQSRYFDDPDRMAPAAGAAAQGHDAYQTMTRSVQGRARFAPADLEAAIARSQGVADDPLRYTSGMVGGSSGSCRELPPAAGPEGTYLATCNRGYELGPATPRSCNINLAVSLGSPAPDGSRPQTDTRDESLCLPLTSNPNCLLQRETCTSGRETRDIEGVSVTRSCWTWTRSYQCYTPRPADDCGDLDASPACSFIRQECLTDARPCTTWERVYRCPVPDRIDATKQYICNGDIYCINGECETIDRQPNTEFRDAAVALNAAKQAGLEFDPDSMTLFKGTRETCHKKVFGLLNCCAGKAFPLIPGASLLVSLGCSREEVLLHQRDAQGLCTYVGTYCSDSVLGVCVTKKKAYCCFESKLSRILQEQGRAQLRKPWSSPKREQCRGFTVDEFARLDLSRMDFSEVYAEFQDAARLPEELSTVTDMQRKISDFHAINGPGK